MSTSSTGATRTSPTGSTPWGRRSTRSATSEPRQRLKASRLGGRDSYGGPGTFPFDAAGSGPPVVLLHAGVADRRMWAAIVPVLAERYRVLAPDLPGYGDAPLSPGPFSNASEVLAFLDDQDIAHASLVGASFGGRVALE